MKRDQQQLENTWDLERMYNPKTLSYDIQECFNIVKKILVYKDIEFDKDTIIDVLKIYYELLIKIENIYVYFSHLQDTDFTNDKNIAIFNKVKGEYNQMMVQTSFLFSKISKVDNEILNSILMDDDYVDYHKTIENIIHNKKRYLSEKEEKIISTYNLTSSAAYQLFSAFTNSDLKFDTIFDSENNEHELTEGTYSIYIRSDDRKLRKNAFNSLFNGYSKFNQTLATNYISELKSSLISMKNRNYNSTLQQALEPNKINEQIYFNLLNSIEDNIEINHEYMKLRKDEMKLDELHLYDIYTTMVADIDEKYEYEQGCDLVRKALKVFPDEYQEALNDALTNRWIDIYENEGKRSGAYSGGSYLSDPYILLNYHNELNDVFTLAHELGHSIHSYFSNKHNPYQNANYKIFIAEVASTVNELLLINYLLENETKPQIKKYLYNYLLEQFRTTMVRQTMFARFELESHVLIEENKEISNVVLNDLYYDINKKYFGNDIVLDEEIKYEWSRIPHFYYNYYVYQYATSFSISLNIVKRILMKEEGIIDKYLSFLKAGDSVYPLEALALIDIDLTNPQVFNEAMQAYNQTISDFKNVKL
ncbi:oligoendopeptidase F [Bacilli bacterium PM5-3]|nr:oligoendopeptidase F [Bacilli bacterium PM5-3]MDH6603265.1 oligoendopeptidase F [Bacilli bacterium PM5-9]